MLPCSSLCQRNPYCGGVVGEVVPPEVAPPVPGPVVEDPGPEPFAPVPGVLLNPDADPNPPLEVAIPPPKMLDFA